MEHHQKQTTHRAILAAHFGQCKSFVQAQGYCKHAVRHSAASGGREEEPCRELCWSPLDDAGPAGRSGE